MVSCAFMELRWLIRFPMLDPGSSGALIVSSTTIITYRLSWLQKTWYHACLPKTWLAARGWAVTQHQGIVYPKWYFACSPMTLQIPLANIFGITYFFGAHQNSSGANSAVFLITLSHLKGTFGIWFSDITHFLLSPGEGLHWLLILRVRLIFLCNVFESHGWWNHGGWICTGKPWGFIDWRVQKWNKEGGKKALICLTENLQTAFTDKSLGT